MSTDIWFTSDLHFGHKRIREFCHSTRRGDTLDEMNEILIQEWNKRVKPYDMIYHLGDFSFMPAERTLHVLCRLNGFKHFIKGNHDKQLDRSEFRAHFSSFKDYKTISIGTNRFVLFHFPIESWDRQHYGTIHLHGHIHGGSSNGEITIIKNRFDVGIDNRGDKLMAPLHIDEVLERVKLQNESIDVKS